MTNSPFSLRLDSDIKAQLKHEAELAGRSESALVALAIKNFLSVREFKRRAIDKSVEIAEKGKFISSETMGAWVDSWGSDDEASLPEADVQLKS